MKPINVHTATNDQLNFLVAKADGLLEPKFNEKEPRVVLKVESWGCTLGWNPSPEVYYEWRYQPTLCWNTIGHVIFDNGITVSKEDQTWSAYIRANLFNEDGSDCWAVGDTPQVAAARCFILLKLGEVVDVPDELA